MLVQDFRAPLHFYIENPMVRTCLPGKNSWRHSCNFSHNVNLIWASSADTCRFWHSHSNWYCTCIYKQQR